MKHAGSLFPVLLIGALAALTFWLQRISEPQVADHSGRLRHDPDFIVDAFTVRRFNDQGNLQHTLKAQRMLHYPDDDSTLVLQPRLTFHGTPPTLLSAQQAHISKDAQQVRLEHAVRLTRAAPGDGVATEVATERLDILPEQETARSDQPVQITQGRSLVTGSGLTADNKLQQITLLGPVRGTIHRNR